MTIRSSLCARRCEWKRKHFVPIEQPSPTNLLIGNNHVKIRTAIIICLISLSLSPLGCTKKPGSEYVGKWQTNEKVPGTIEIIDNGENYLLKLSSTPGKTTSSLAPLVGTVHDGVLQAGNATLTYIKSTGAVTMTVPGVFTNNVVTLTKVK